MIISMDHFIELLEQEMADWVSDQEAPASTDTLDVEPFDYNRKLLYKLFRNALNDRAYGTAYDVLHHANEYKIQLY